MTDWKLTLETLSAREVRCLQNQVDKKVYQDIRGLEEERDILATSLSEALSKVEMLEELLMQNNIEFN